MAHVSTSRDYADGLRAALIAVECAHDKELDICDDPKVSLAQRLRAEERALGIARALDEVRRLHREARAEVQP